MIVLLIGLAIFVIGFSLGYFTNKYTSVKHKSSGTIYVTQNEEKTLYSLELDDYPESLAFKKEVVFKVSSPKKSPRRE